MGKRRRRRSILSIKRLTWCVQEAWLFAVVGEFLLAALGSGNYGRELLGVGRILKGGQMLSAPRGRSQFGELGVIVLDHRPRFICSFRGRHEGGKSLRVTTVCKMIMRTRGVGPCSKVTFILTKHGLRQRFIKIPGWEIFRHRTRERIQTAITFTQTSLLVRSELKSRRMFYL